MSKDNLIFRRINIIRTAGFNPPGFSVKGLEPQINIIYGPNGIGKTTLARAFSYLIWPELASDNVSIQGNFSLNNIAWFAEINAGSFKYQKDGTPSSRPPFPSLEHNDRYYISLHDLLQKDINDRSFAEIIIRESSGGYQLSEAVDQLDLRDRPSRKGRATKKAQKKIKAYLDLRRKQEQLEDEERSLERLYRELAEIKDGQKQLEIIKQAIVYSRADTEFKEIEAEFEQFPEAMEEVTGNEEKELKGIKENIRDYKNKKKKAEDIVSEAEQVINEVDLPDSGVEESFLTELKVKKERLKSREDKIEHLEEELQEAVTRRKEEQKSFINFIQEESLTEIDGTAYNELSNFARRAEKVHNKLASFTSMKSFLKPEEEPSEQESLIQNGIKYLEEWLRAPEDRVLEKHKVRNISLISSLVILLLSVFTGLIINPWFLLLILISAGIVWYGLGQHEKSPDYRKIAREGFNQLGLVAQKDWEEKAVKARLEELYDIEAKIKLFKRRKHYWEDRKEEYRELLRKQEKIEQKRIELIDRYGVAPDTDERTLFHLTNRLSRWQDAHSMVRSLGQKFKTIKKGYRDLLQEVNRMLEGYGYQPVSEAAKVSGIITELEERNNRFKQAMRNKAEAEKTIDDCSNNLKKAKKNREDLFAKLNLKPEDEALLGELCTNRDDYLDVKKQLGNIKHLRQREKEKLEGFTGFDRSLLEEDLAELKQEKRELEHKVEKYETVQGKISEIETKIVTVREGRNVEEALVEKERALDILEVELNRDYEKLAGKVLADHIKEVNTAENRPEVFKRARELFATITRGNYRLVLENSEFPSFRAIDTVSGEGKSLNELSSGTRIQLLLSVRLAFVDMEEEGLVLPLYLDETLANVDDRKAEAIINSVIELARNGRQCFYFTAQKDEVVKWSNILADEASVNYNIIDLAEHKEMDKINLIADIDQILPDIDQTAAAEGMSHVDYGQALSVPDFNPRRGAESIHLWYLIEDPELIEHFLGLGIEKWGQLKTLIKTGRQKFIPEEKREKLKEIQELGRCLEEFVECWHVGRGRPVDRSVLLDSNAVSDNFIDEVSDLATTVDGQAEIIIKELRNGAVPRFLTKKIDELEQFFVEEGYINLGDTLLAEEIYARMLSVLTVNGEGNLQERVNRLLERLK